MTELKMEIDSSTIIDGDCNIPLSVMNRTTRQKKSKEAEDMNRTKNKPDLTEICLTLPPRSRIQILL